MENSSLCPVCGKTDFTEYYEICKFCGWENDCVYDGGGANWLTLDEYKKRYQSYLELNPNYCWRTDVYPEITLEDEYRMAHKYCSEHEESIKKSEKCGCFFCFKIFKPEEIVFWLKGKEERTALCPYCMVDSVLPDSVVPFDLEFLKGMYKVWFEPKEKPTVDGK